MSNHAQRVADHGPVNTTRTPGERWSCLFSLKVVQPAVLRALSYLPHLPGSLPAHPPREHFPLDDLVHRLPSDRLKAGELLAAMRALHVTAGTILHDALDEALDQSTRPALAVAIEQCPALQTVNSDRAARGAHGRWIPSNGLAKMSRVKAISESLLPTRTGKSIRDFG